MKKLLLFVVMFTLIVTLCSCSFLPNIGKQETKPAETVAETAAGTTEAVTEEITETVPAEKVSGEFVNDTNLVECGGTIYYVDKNGLWKNDGKEDSELLYECSALNLATDGSTIYYGVFNEEVEKQYEGISISVNQYDMYEYDIASGENKKLTSFIEAGVPVCAVDDVVYYLDYTDDFDGNAAGVSKGLRSYDKSSGEKKYIEDGAHMAVSYGSKIFYRAIMAAGGGFGVHQIHCYDISSGKSEIISDDSVYGFKVVSDKLMYYIINNNTADTPSMKICSYDINSDKTDTLFEKTGDIQVSDLNDKYAVISEGYSDDLKLIYVDLLSGDEKELSSSDFENSYPNKAICYDDNAVFYSRHKSGNIYTADIKDMSMRCSKDTYDWRELFAVKDNIAFAIPNTDEDNNYYFYTMKCVEI